MFTKCANPQCNTRFEYRLGGRFYRFHQGERARRFEPNTHSVVHFWLCPECAEFYALDYDGIHCVLVQSTAYCTGSRDLAAGSRNSEPGEDFGVTLIGSGKGAGA